MKKHLTIVIKLGTSSIVNEKSHEPLLSILSTIVETAVSLHHEGHRIVICSSGAIGLALRQMDMQRRPKHLPQVQALAAIGQCKLMAMWDQLFAHLRQPVAQILLTRNDIADRTQYLNAQNTFAELLSMGVIPIVNENDTLSVQEIKFGDNDTLSAITAGMVQADYLFLMTDVDCLYDKNPRTHPDAKPIEIVEDIADISADVSSAGSSLGTGGMSTKIVAARLATAAGVTTVITKSSKPGNIASIVRYVESQKAAQRSMESSLHLSAPSTPQKESAPSTVSSPQVKQDAASTSVSSPLVKSEIASSAIPPPQADEEAAPSTVSSALVKEEAATLEKSSPLAKQETISATTSSQLKKEGAAAASAAVSSSTLNQEAASSTVSSPQVKSEAAPATVSFAQVNGNTNDSPGVEASSTPVVVDAPIPPLHTRFLPDLHPIRDRYFWLLHGLAPHGTIYIDQGAYTALSKKAGLLPVGIVDVAGDFGQHECARISVLPSRTSDLSEGEEVARALVNYSAAEIRRIRGMKSDKIAGVLGYADSEYVALRENVGLLKRPESRPTTPMRERAISMGRLSNYVDG